MIGAKECLCKKLKKIFGGLKIPPYIAQKLKDMTKYKLRAECVNDIRFMFSDGRFKNIQGSRDLLFTDCEISFESDLNFFEIFDILRSKPNTHVAMQTLAECNEYNGERNYNIR